MGFRTVFWGTIGLRRPKPGVAMVPQVKLLVVPATALYALVEAGRRL